MYITFIIVYVSKIYSIATVNIRIAAAGQLHDTRVDQRKLCALSRRRVVQRNLRPFLGQCRYLGAASNLSVT